MSIDPDNLDVPARIPSISHPYKILDCLFNHENVYGNIQLENRVPLVSFDLRNPRLWKSMEASAVSALHYSRPFMHSPRIVKISQSKENAIMQARNIERKAIYIMSTQIIRKKYSIVVTLLEKKFRKIPATQPFFSQIHQKFSGLQKKS